MVRLFACVLAAAVCPLARAADWVPGTRMAESVTTVMNGAREVTDLGDYGFDGNVCILSGFLLSDQELTFNRPFDKGKSYLILGGADKNVTALDVDIYDADGTRVAGETDDEVSPTIKFKPTRSANFKIRVALRKTKGKGGGFCTLAFLRKGGYDLPVTNLRTALETVTSACDEVNKLAKTKVWFQSGNNQWALYGAVLEQGETQTITKVKLGKGDRMLVAGGDRNAEDVDVFFLDEDDDVLARDKGRDPFAFAKFTEDTTGFRKIAFKNAKSKRAGPALILTAVLVFDD